MLCMLSLSDVDLCTAQCNLHSSSSIVHSYTLLRCDKVYGYIRAKMAPFNCEIYCESGRNVLRPACFHSKQH